MTTTCPRFHHLSCFLLFLLSGFWSLTSYAQAVAANTSSVQQDSLLAVLERYDVPGASILTFSAGDIDQTFYLGLADVASDRPVTSQTRFCVGSIAKSFLAAAVLKAHAEEVIDIYQPLRNLSPSLEYSNGWEAISPITIAHLLEHSSGFDEAHFDLEARADSRTPLAEITALSASSLHTEWEPGTANVYNNLGVIVAAHLLESATGSELETYVDRQIFIPLGLTSATYRPGGSQFATGYQGKEEAVPFPDIAQWPVGALSMTGSDLARFVRMLLQNGLLDGKQVLQSTGVAIMQRPESYLGAPYGLAFGYGKGLIHTLEKKQHFVGHTGQYGGFVSEYGYSEDLDFGYLILLNSRDGGKAIREIKQQLIPEQKANNATPLTYVPSGDYLDSLTGSYQLTGSSLGLLYPFLRLADIQQLRNEGGQLVQRSVLGGDRVLKFVSKYVLREVDQPVGTGLVVAKADRQVLRSDGTDYHRIGTFSAYLQFWLAANLHGNFCTSPNCCPDSVADCQTTPVPHHATLLFASLPFGILALAVGQWLLLYDTTVLYSVGAVLYFILSWLFGLAVLVSLYVTARSFTSPRLGALIKSELLVLTLVSTTIFGYLLYWGLIGLGLWSY